MTEKLGGIVEFLGEKNVDVLREGILDLLLDRVAVDLDDLNIYLLDYDRMMDEIREEVQETLKKRYIEALMPKIDAKFAEMMGKENA